MEKMIIIGSGPAAHTAAIYAARAKIQPLMFEGFMAGGIAAGGQLTTTNEIENFPGFPQSIMGPELMVRMRAQSIKCGARIETKTVDRAVLTQQPFKIFAGKQEHEAQCVIIATGATAKRLHLPGEERLWQKGVSACAVCDGALPIFRDKVLVVVGGGDTAVEEALHLTKYASQVKILHRRNELRASKAMQDKIFTNKKIEVVWDTVPLEIQGEKLVTAVKVKNVKTDKESVIECGGFFYAIGHKPNTDFLGNQITLDEHGYIVTNPKTMQTNIPGVFACGDVQDKRFRQAIAAAGTGCMAALEAERYLNEKGLL